MRALTSRRSRVWPKLERMRTRRQMAVSMKGLSSARRRSRATWKRTRPPGSSSSSETSMALLRAPVSILASMAAMPHSGMATSSRQPMRRGADSAGSLATIPSSLGSD